MSDYYYANEGERRGPVSLDELRRVGLEPHTLVWREGMADWEPARIFPELADLFQHKPLSGAARDPAAISGPSFSYASKDAFPSQTPSGGALYPSSGSAQPLPRRTEYDDMIGPPPKTWLLEAILATVFCCLPFGIAGIVNASKVETRHFAGDVEGAAYYSREAAKWTKISAGLAIVGWVLSFIFAAIIGFGAAFG